MSFRPSAAMDNASFYGEGFDGRCAQRMWRVAYAEHLTWIGREIAAVLSTFSTPLRTALRSTRPTYSTTTPRLAPQLFQTEPIDAMPNVRTCMGCNGTGGSADAERAVARGGDGEEEHRLHDGLMRCCRRDGRLGSGEYSRNGSVCRFGGQSLSADGNGFPT